jgi:hypothetical protein
VFTVVVDMVLLVVEKVGIDPISEMELLISVLVLVTNIRDSVGGSKDNTGT